MSFQKFLLFFFFIFCVFLFGKNDSIRKNTYENRVKNYNKKCDIDKLKAIEDSKTKTIYFINVPAPDGEEFLQHKEFSKLLKKHNVEFGGTWMRSDVAGYYSANECYYSYMTHEAEKKFGKFFFEEKNNEALRQFLRNNPDKIFDYRRQELDFSPILLEAIDYDDQKSIIEAKFWKKYKLPKDYIKRKNGELHSYINAFFILNKDEKISDLKIESNFQNEQNEKYSKYFKNNFKKIIASLKFKVKRYKGYPVKSRESLILYLP